MNLGVSSTTRTDIPHCFGNPVFWDRNAPECAGGPDASYIDPETQKNVRRQCNFFSSCGARVSMKVGGVIPPERLVRPPVVTPPPAQPSYRPYNAPTPPATSFAEFVRNLDSNRQRATGGQPGVQPPQVQPPMAWTTNYAIPSFLTAQEVRHPGESWWAPFLRMLLRGMGKAIGHVAAHWFDVHVLKAAPPEKKD